MQRRGARHGARQAAGRLFLHLTPAESGDVVVTPVSGPVREIYAAHVARLTGKSATHAAVLSGDGLAAALEIITPRAAAEIRAGRQTKTYLEPALYIRWLTATATENTCNR